MAKSPVTTKASTASPVQPPKDNPTQAPAVPSITVKPETTTASTEQKPLAPPARPAPPQDYFSEKHAPPTAHLAFEPNPFEASFRSGGVPETPGGTQLPPLNSIGGVTPNFWGNSSLRTGPLSPAMLSGPTAGNEDYFGGHHGLRGGYPTPNESSLRTGLTPGGGGSMFPVTASPNSQAIYNQLQSGGATPSTLDFHRTAMTAAAAAANERNKLNASAQHTNITSQPQDNNGADSSKAQQRSDAYAQFDANDAANGLTMLANQGAANGAAGNGYMAPQSAFGQPAHQGPNGADINNRDGNSLSTASGRSKRNLSEISGHSDESEQAKPNTRGKGKKPTGNGRRKADDPPAKAPNAKKTKANSSAAMEPEPASEEELDMSKDQYNADGKKQTDDEKRKNFLERNRIAALKCRQRKKTWVQNLQEKVESFAFENQALSREIAELNAELDHLKSLLANHENCPVTQQAIAMQLGHPMGHNMGQPIPHPHEMGYIGQQQPPQQVMPVPGFQSNRQTAMP